MTDEELISRIQQGDKAAAEELIYRWYPSILRYCKSRCRSRETAEDLTQETFLRLFLALPNYNENGKFKAYIFLIANRLCIDESRKTPLSMNNLSWQEKPRSEPGFFSTFTSCIVYGRMIL